MRHGPKDVQRGLLLPIRVHCCNGYSSGHLRRVYRSHRVQLFCRVLLPRGRDERGRRRDWRRMQRRELLPGGLKHREWQRRVQRRVLLRQRRDDGDWRRDRWPVQGGLLLPRGLSL